MGNMFSAPIDEDDFRDMFKEALRRISPRLEKYVDASELANQLKLEINAGHDLNLENLALFSKLPYLAEVSIGHAIVVDSFNRGFQSTIQDYLEALQRR